MRGRIKYITRIENQDTTKEVALITKGKLQPGVVVVYACSPSTWEADVGGLS